MKKLLSAISICSIAALGCVVSSAHADTGFSAKSNKATVWFLPEEKGKEYFWCTVSDPKAVVTVQTGNVDAQGFCPSGHGPVSGAVFNTSYFTVNGAGIRPYVKLTVTKGHFIGCPSLGSQTTPSGLSQYGAGQDFCLSSAK